jgi:integrase
MDFESSDVSSFTIQRSFDSRTHKVKEWNPALKAHGKVAVPPNLVCELEGWKKFGDTEDRPDGYIFPTRNGTCLIPTNWAEDVLKPAGEKVGIPDVSYHWFRRGHATVQHHDGHEGDKSIQGQLRHASPELTRKIYMQQIDEETWQSVVNLERLVNEHGLDKKGA